MKEKNPIEAAICLIGKWPKGKTWSMDFKKVKCNTCNQRTSTCTMVVVAALKLYFETVDLIYRTI